MARLVSAAARKPACLAPRQCVNIIAHSLLSLSRSLSFLPSPSSERGILHRMERPPAGRPPRSLTLDGRTEECYERANHFPPPPPTVQPPNHSRRNGQREGEQASSDFTTTALRARTHFPDGRPTQAQHSRTNGGGGDANAMEAACHFAFPPQCCGAVGCSLGRSVWPSQCSPLTYPHSPSPRFGRRRARGRASDRARDVTKNVPVVRKCLDHPRKGERRKEGRKTRRGGGEGRRGGILWTVHIPTAACCRFLACRQPLALGSRSPPPGLQRRNERQRRRHVR